MQVNTFFGKVLKGIDGLNKPTSIVHNKFVLYAIFFISLINLLYSAVKEEYLYCILFILVGFVISFFNKNMTVILTLTIATTTIFHNIIYGKQMIVNEGFDASPTTMPAKKNTNSTDNDTTESVRNIITGNVSLGGNTFAGNVTSQPSANLVNNLRDQAMDLQDAQKNIIKGFETISPYMDKAENIINSIQTTAQTIQSMKTTPPHVM